MPNRAAVSDGSDLNLFSGYDAISTTHKLIEKKKKHQSAALRKHERLPHPTNGGLDPRMLADDMDPFFDDAQAMAEQTRYMGVTSNMDQRLLATTLSSSLNSMPWYMVITNETVREKLQDMARDAFVCAECNRDVIEIENRGRWQCQLPVTWRPRNSTPGEFKKVRFMVRADHRRSGAPAWSDPAVSTVRVPTSVLAVMDGTARPLHEAIVTDSVDSTSATKIQNAIQSQDTDVRMAEQFVRDSRVVLRYSVDAMQTAVRYLTFYENEHNDRLRNKYIREAMAEVFDLSKTKSGHSIRAEPYGTPLYILKKEMISA